MAKVLVVKESRQGESRVAATPETVKRLKKEGFHVLVEEGAGSAAHIPDEAFSQAEAELVPPYEAWGASELILKVGPLQDGEAERVGEKATVMGLLAPYSQARTAAILAERGVASLAMELVPRITRAQKMDALSSQASISGYKSVLLAASALGKYFPLMMTAAGTVQPAKVVVMGAGVAGLQAIATARRLGATVDVSDVRPEAKEQVESLGGRFIDLPTVEGGEGEGGYAKELSESALQKQQQIIADKVAAADVVITTALVPGRPAPRLITGEMVSRMKPGAVIVDLAVESGGNCEFSEADRVVEKGGVRILAPSNLPATVPLDASHLYSRNLLEVVLHLGGGGSIRLDPSDEIVGAMLWTHEGKVRHGPTADRIAKGATA